MAHTWLRDPIALAITALAAARITRLLTTDQLPGLPETRRHIEDHLPPRWAHGVTCPWCVGMWTAAAAVTLAEVSYRRGHHHAFLLAALPWAYSTVTGILADHEVH